MKIPLASFLSCALLTLASFAQQGTVLHIRGHVTDGVTHRDLAGVAVSAVEARHSTTTDANGFFSLELRDGSKPGDDIRIHVEKKGYRADDLIVAISETVTQPIQLAPLGKSSRRDTVNAAPTLAAPTRDEELGQSAGLRERGLRLSNDIIKFLSDREQRDPHPEQAPRSYGAMEGAANNVNSSPVYMQETLRLFAERFEGKIADIRDELASRCLHDSGLDSLYRNPSLNIFGNVDAAIKNMADSISKLALLVPPESLYRDVSDTELIKLAMEESTKIEQKNGDAMTKLENGGGIGLPPNAIRSVFASDFRDCCLSQVEYLRAELIKRTGPTACDTDEMRSFNEFNEIARDPLSSIATSLDYAPHFRQLIIRFKRNLDPSSGQPETLAHSAAQIPSGLLVTVETKVDIASGYILIQFDGKHDGAVSVGFDLPDATRIPFCERDEIDDPQFCQLLTVPLSTFAFKIGRTPFRTNTKAHFLAKGQYHVVRVLYFDD